MGATAPEATFGETAQFWSHAAALSPRRRWRARVPLQALVLVWSHDGRTLYAGCADKTVRVFRLPDTATP